MEKREIQEKLDRIALYLMAQRLALPSTERNIQKWQDLQEAIEAIDAARKKI